MWLKSHGSGRQHFSRNIWVTDYPYHLKDSGGGWQKVNEDNLQSRIDEVRWYHEFDFSDNLKARSHEPDVESHRRIWSFIAQHLERIDFRDKTVLDIGAWDGYWSFHAERRGASQVLAADDLSQNWSTGQGIHLAKELFASSISIDQDTSIYQLTSLNRRFDIIMCFGVHYHLLDPFHAFSQIRHCCHSDTIVLLAGTVGKEGMRADEARYSFRGSRMPTFMASAALLENLLQAAYLEVKSVSWLRPGRFRRLIGLLHHFKYYQSFDTTFVDEAFIVCRPFEGINEVHPYEPPFGLKKYDSRF